jgi:glycogen synthase
MRASDQSEHRVRIFSRATATVHTCWSPGREPPNKGLESISFLGIIASVDVFFGCVEHIEVDCLAARMPKFVTDIEQRQKRPIYYAAVAGDVAGTYQRWRGGKRDERQVAATYSGQFFDLCKASGRPGAASFPSEREELIRDASFVVRSRPPNRTVGGVRYYIDQFKRACWVYADVLRTKAVDVIVMDGVTFFFLLAPLVWSGCRIFLSIHTVLWRDGTRPKFLHTIVRSLNGWFFRTKCAGCLVASPAIAQQVSKLGGPDLRTAIFYPLYEKADFERFTLPNHGALPFRIFFAGRVEVDKGVLDLVMVMRDLVRAGRAVHLDVCGDGGAMQQLCSEVIRFGLQDFIAIHGHVDRPNMLELLESAQLVVVPTRSEFPEGLNQVVIEAVLARRPVVTSAICPALPLIAPAAVEAIADSCESYRASIERLMDDPQFFLERVNSGGSLREKFFDPSEAWTAQALHLMQRHSD